MTVRLFDAKKANMHGPAIETQPALAVPSARGGLPQSGAPAGGQLLRDLLAGVTVALVAIPQCIAFSTMTGLPAVAGLYSAVTMGLVSAVLSKSPRLVVGPAITASTMLLAVLQTVAPTRPEQWPAIAGALAVLVGFMTVAAAILNIGRFVRFVSRSVIVGLVAGSAILTIGSQLAPLLGLPCGRHPMLIGILWNTLADLNHAHGTALLMAGGTAAFVAMGSRVGPRFPAPFAALVLGGALAWWLENRGMSDGLQTIGELPWRWPTLLSPLYAGPYSSDLVVGAASICMVGIIQNLAIAKALAERADEPLHARQELWALGMANVAAGLVHGFPGSASFARSALSDLTGARTRLAGLAAAVATAMIAALGAPWARYITLPSIAGLLVVTVLAMVDWRELAHVLRRDPNDRPVLLITVLSVFFLPIHWAVLFGLAASIILFLRRVSRLHLFEMVRGDDGAFHEQAIDARTGTSAITMLQLEGPLFFAHADEMTETLGEIFDRRPFVTILRMRRTHQIDFSVITAIERVIRKYQASGGQVVICGLTPKMRETIIGSPLGDAIGLQYVLETNREVFGSARRAIEAAEAIVAKRSVARRPLFRGGRGPGDADDVSPEMDD